MKNQADKPMFGGFLLASKTGPKVEVSMRETCKRKDLKTNCLYADCSLEYN